MLTRHIEKTLLRSLKTTPITLLRGARQTGKTTLVQSLLSTENKYNYITFDHLPSLSAAKDDPIGFISRLEKPVILDEIQRVPELFLPIKSDVDTNRTAGRYILTGSADPLLLPKIGDTLAGRLRLLTLWPLSQGELHSERETFIDRIFEGKPTSGGKSTPCSKQDIIDKTFNGGYPTLLNLESSIDRQNWFNDYVTLVLQKDILDLSKIENVSQIPNLLKLLASRVGGLLNTEELSRTFKLSTMTVHRYLDLLKTLFLICFIPAWNKNLGKRQVKSPKLYLCDTALQLFSLNMDKERLEKEPQLLGSSIENFVVLELLKQLSWSEKTIQIYHYRDYRQTEVDIVLEGPAGEIVAIEIKSSETVSKSDFKGLDFLRKTVGKKFLQGILLYSGAMHLPFGENLTASPISTLWHPT